ncbi:MAG: histidinol-phosphatase [Sulfurospirillum sp.]|nr:histidinol-phosphatase [Sulfurospirillum sp.]MBL0702991.1 histidinol-phosphatase [Sulfurospirillum sp.]
MSVDLHNHTILCKHATGTLEEYVEKAIEKNIDFFGFSDHAPMNYAQDYRMKFEQMNQYEKSILDLRKVYQNRIHVLLGYEVDFLVGFMDDRVINANVDYLIGSVHFVNKWGFDNPKYIGEYKNKNIDKIWEDYFEELENLAKSGLFNIVGHIDLIKVFNYLPKKDIKLLALKAIKEIKKANMAVEINAAGFRKPIKEAYPSKSIMELLSEYDIPITFGSDSHAPHEVGLNKDKIHSLASHYGYSKCANFIKKERFMVEF